MNHKASIVSLTNLFHSPPPPELFHQLLFHPFSLCLQFHFLQKEKKLKQSERLVSFIFCHFFSFLLYPCSTSVCIFCILNKM